MMQRETQLTFQGFQVLKYPNSYIFSVQETFYQRYHEN
jgi:hypothetical protein